MLTKKGQSLRIFLAESNRHGDMPLYEWIVRQARSSGMAGATVLRGMEGFGADSHMHTAKILRLAQDLPIIIEIIDTREKIQRFISSIDHIIAEGLATIEDIEIHFYQGGKKSV